MSRRGKCRCGKILVFERTAQGYKVRCPNCQAVVRLRAEETAQPPRSIQPPPLPLPTPAASFVTDLHTPELVEEVESLELLHLHASSAPTAMVEMEIYHEPKNAARGGLWILIGLAVVGLVLAVGAIVLVLNNPS